MVTGSVFATQPVIQVQDASSGVVAGATNNVTATLVGGGGTLNGTTTVAAVNGIATFTDLGVTGAGNYTITFSSGALTPVTSIAVGITAAPATQLAIGTQPSGAVSNVALTTQPVIQVRDAGNGTVAGATNAVTATLNGAGGTLTGTTTVNAVNGVATFTDLKVVGGGTYTITFSSPSLTSATSGNITITTLPATHLFVATQPSSPTTSGQPFSTQPIVHVRDASNGVVTGATNAVTATINGAGGLLFGTTTVNAVNGIATFTDLDAMPAGTYTITFAAAGLTSATTASFTVVSGAATQLTLQTQPAGGSLGAEPRHAARHSPGRHHELARHDRVEPRHGDPQWRRRHVERNNGSQRGERPGDLYGSQGDGRRHLHDHVLVAIAHFGDLGLDHDRSADRHTALRGHAAIVTDHLRAAVLHAARRTRA